MLKTLPPQEHVTDFHNVYISGKVIHVHIHPEDAGSLSVVRSFHGKLHPNAIASRTLPFDVNIQVHREASKCAIEDQHSSTHYFMKPYHINNLGHMYNENVLPMIETMQFPEQKNRTLVTFLEYGMSGPALPVWFQIWNSLKVDVTRRFPQGCIRHLAWGLGIKPFWHPGRLRQSGQTVAKFRQSLFAALLMTSRSKKEINIWIRRNPKNVRSIDDASIRSLASSLNIKITHCCNFNKQTFRDQLLLISRSSLMFGLHGAGLANAIFAKRGSILVELFGGYGIGWVTHRRSIQTIGGGYIAAKVIEARTHHIINESHAHSIRSCISDLRGGNANRCQGRRHIIQAIDVGSEWDCRNTLESGDAAPCAHKIKKR